MTKFTLTIILSLSISLSSLADEPSTEQESNLINFSYPSHSCGEKINKPKKIARLKTFEDVNDYNSAIVEYNIEVSAYNEAIKIYKSCINNYIKNGNHDINIIKKSLSKALKEARAK